MEINYSYQTKNFDERPIDLKIDYIILHATNRNFDTSLDLLTNSTNNPVSCHFLIDLDGTIYQLLACRLRAWHAGPSYWRNQEKLNNNSIGIEIVNFNDQPYQANQINSCIHLCKSLIKKYHIEKRNILAHSDIAPYRKIDPGHHFPWHKLAEENIVPLLNRQNNSVSEILDDAINLLTHIGYDTRPINNNPEALEQLISSFQRRYYQDNVTGILDLITYNFIKQVASAVS